MPASFRDHKRIDGWFGWIRISQISLLTKSELNDWMAVVYVNLCFVLFQYLNP